jgi:hypothetical protein
MMLDILALGQQFASTVALIRGTVPLGGRKSLHGFREAFLRGIS